MSSEHKLIFQLPRLIKARDIEPLSLEIYMKKSIRYRYKASYLLIVIVRTAIVIIRHCNYKNCYCKEGIVLAED